MQITKHYMYKKNFYGWDEKTYWMSIHGQFSAVGGSGMVRENKEFLCCMWDCMSLCVHVCVCHSNTLGSISTKTVRGVVACCGICEKLVSSIKFFIQTKYSLQRRKGGMGVGHWDFVSSTSTPICLISLTLCPKKKKCSASLYHPI